MSDSDATLLVSLKRDYCLEFVSPEEVATVTLQNPHQFSVEWQALLPVSGPKLFKLKPTKGTLGPNSEVNILLEIRPESSQIGLQSKEKVVFSVKDLSGALPEVKRGLRVFRTYLSQDITSTQNSLLSSSLTTASQVLSGLTSSGGSPPPPSTPSPTVQTSTTGSSGSNSPSTELSKSELELKDPGFSMTLLLPIAVACIIIWLLQTSKSFMYSPLTTFLVGMATSYVHFRIINPRKSSTPAAGKPK